MHAQQQHLHSEAAQYAHHYTALANNGKTINLHTYRNCTIKHKAAGNYTVGEMHFPTLEAAKGYIDSYIYECLTAFYNMMGVVCSQFPNCLVYQTHIGEHIKGANEANILIAQMKLPLVAEPTTYPNGNTFTVKFSGHGF